MGLDQYIADQKKAKAASGESINPEIFANLLTQSTFKNQAEDVKPKTSWWKKVISVLTSGETGNAVYQMLNGKNPVEEYGKDIIKGITGQGYDKKTYADVLEKIGFGTQKISDIFPNLYSDDGKGVKLRKGGFLDWSGNGTVGLALDIVLDPTTYLGGLGLFQRMGVKGKGLTTAGKSIFDGTNTRVAKIYNELGTTDESLKMVQDITERMTKKFAESPDKYYKGITMFGQNVIPRKVALAPGRLFDSTMQHIPVLGKVYTGAKAGVQDMFVYGADVVRKGKSVSQVGGESAEDYIKLKQQMFKRSREISDNIFDDVTKAMKEFEKGVSKDKRGAVLDYVRNKVETGFADFGIEGVDKNLADNLVTIAERHAKKFYRTEAEAYAGLTKDMYSEVSNYLGHIITDEGRQALKGKAANKFLSKGYSEFATSPEKARSWFKFVDTKTGDELLGSAEKFGLKPYNRGTEVRFLTDKATSVVKKRQNEIKRIMREINNLTKEQIHEALRETGEKLPSKIAELKTIPKGAEIGKKTLTEIGKTPNGLRLLRESAPKTAKETKYILNTAELKNNETLKFVEQMINLPKKSVERLAKKIQTRTGWVDDTMKEITSITDDLATKVNELPTIKRWFTDSTGSVFRVERHASIDEINTKLASIMEEAGFKGKPFFMTDPFEIVYHRGTKGAKNIAAAEYYKDVSSKLGIKGTPTEVFSRNELTRKTTKELVYKDIIDPKTGIRYVDPKIAVLPEGTMLPDFMVQDLKKVKSLIDDEEVGNKILQVYDKILGEWKGSVYGWYPASHGRNLIGGIWNNFLAGLFPGDKRYFMVRKVLKGGDDTIKASNGAVVTFKELKKSIATRGVLGQTGYLDVNDLRNAFHPSMAKKAKDVPMKAMELVENNLRIPLYIKAWQDTGSFDEAAKMVFKYHFDYAPEALTTFERTVMKRIIPFYRWTRGNIPLMLEEFIAQPAKMTGLFKATRDMQDENGNIQMDLLPSYIEREFAITRGGQTVTGTGLPPLEMLKYMREPIRQLESGLTPFMKIPLEIRTNYSLFKDMAVSEDTSGTFAEKYPQILKDWLQYQEKVVEKKDGTSYTIKSVDPMRKYWMYALPTARLASLASTVMGEKEKNKLLNAITGLRTFEFDMQQLKDSQQKIYEQKLIDILTNAGLFGQIEYPFADTKEAAGIKSTPAKSKNPLNRGR